MYCEFTGSTRKPTAVKPRKLKLEDEIPPEKPPASAVRVEEEVKYDKPLIAKDEIGGIVYSTLGQTGKLPLSEFARNTVGKLNPASVKLTKRNVDRITKLINDNYDVGVGPFLNKADLRDYLKSQFDVAMPENVYIQDTITKLSAKGTLPKAQRDSIIKTLISDYGIDASALATKPQILKLLKDRQATTTPVKETPVKKTPVIKKLK